MDLTPFSARRAALFVFTMVLLSALALVVVLRQKLA